MCIRDRWYQRRVHGATVLSPLIVIKTQMEVAGVKGNMTIKENVSRTLSDIGVRGLWAGLIPSILKEAPYSGLQLVFIEAVKAMLPSSLGLASTTIASPIGSVAAVLLTHPFDNLRVRYQCSGLEVGDKSIIQGKHYRSYWMVIKDIADKEGFHGFYRGLTAMALKRAISAPFIWTLVELLKRCLLYTSPSPRDRQKSRMPSSA
eukprot:TRINITY_DN12138_c0_g1_i3.p1 TRINITY_DN12138_c0_g1~~TRINITY_DN12138_c0_g1_i3.p1  ORF type:complete len:204 (+),score=43.08 TRINITY_DN12138_c0_g1_i3:83-694(+)